MVRWMAWPVHRAAGQAPCRLRWSKAPVARAGPPVEDAPPSDVEFAEYPGEAANSPACAVAGQPGQRDRADLGPVRAVGGVVAGDHGPRTGSAAASAARRRTPSRPGRPRRG